MNPVSGTKTPVSSRVAAILEEVRALPPTDRETFAKLFRVLEPVGEVNPELAADEIQPVVWPDFAGRMRKLFPGGPISGDLQKFWDELRRE